MELRIAKYASKEKAIVYDIDICKILEKLLDCELADVRDPMGISGLVPACKTTAKKEEALSKLSTAVTRARNAVNCRHDNNIDKAFEWWAKVFNGEFPAR